MNQLWYASRGKQKLGPFSSAQLRAQARSGELQPHDLLLLDGKTKWVTVASVKGLVPAATEAAIPTPSRGDPVSSATDAPPARQGAAADESPLPSGTGLKSLLLRARKRPWVLAACCAPIVLGLIIWGLTKVGRAQKSTLQQDSLAGFSSSGSDLDDLARLLSQDVIVGTNEFHRPQDPVWIEAMKKLRSSSDKAVAAAVAAAEDAVTLRADALGLDSKVNAENSARMHKSLTKNSFAAIFGLDYRANDLELDDAVRDGQLTQQEAAAYRGARDRGETAQLELIGDAFQSYVNRYYADPKVRAARIDAEAKESDVFVKHLVPALQARAGAKTDASPLDLKVGQRSLLVRTSSERLMPGSTRNEMLVLASASSRYDRELTRLSLLFKIRRRYYSTLVTAYIPCLRPSESFRLIPIQGAWRMGTHEEVSEGGVAVRYSVWCDQFAIEDRELPLEGYEGATLAYGVQALLGDIAYLCDPVRNRIGSYAPAVARTEKSRIKSPPQREFFGRYGLTFTEVKPEGDAYKVQARLDEYEVDSKETIVSSATCAGVLRVVPEKKPQSSGLFVSPEVAQQRREAKMEEDKKKQEENQKKRATAPPKTRAERRKEAAQERQKADQEKQEQTIQRKLEHAELVCELEAEGKKHRFDIRIEVDGHLKWTALDPPLKSRFVLPAEQVKKREQRIAETRDKNDRLRKARNLAMQGKKDEAEKALNDFIATSPGELWEKWAKEILSHLDQYAERGAR